MKLWPLLFLIAALAIALYAYGAKAHWSGNYKNPVTGNHCCDLADCHPIPKEAYEFRHDGIQLTKRGVIYPYEQTLPSEDGDVWECVWGGKVQCVFIPVSG